MLFISTYTLLLSFFLKTITVNYELCEFTSLTSRFPQKMRCRTLLYFLSD